MKITLEREMVMEERKKLLTYPELIKKLERNGILFNTVDKVQATKILQERNYFYKLSSYRKLFPKTNGKYNIEFATLADLAVVDMQLRYFLLDICLDVEHGIKTVIMDAITKNRQVDGYDIVKDYAVYNPIGFNNTKQALSKNKYLKNVYLKHQQDIPIWVLIEVMDFGNLCHLVEMYCNKFPSNKKLKKANSFCKYARHIRNACAHSNVLLVDMLEQTVSPSTKILSLAGNQNIKRDSLQYRKTHDIYTLVTLHQEYCSKELSKYRRSEILKIAKRAKKHKDYYENNPKIVEIYQKLAKILVNIPKK